MIALKTLNLTKRLLSVLVALSMMLSMVSCTSIPSIPQFDNLPSEVQKMLDKYYYSGDISTKQDLVSSLNKKCNNDLVLTLPTFCSDTGSADILVLDVCQDDKDQNQIVVETTYALGNGERYIVLEHWDISTTSINWYQLLSCEEEK